MGLTMDRSTFPLHETGNPCNEYSVYKYTESSGGMLLLSLLLAGQRQGRMSVLLHQTHFPAFDDQVVSPLCYW